MESHPIKGYLFFIVLWFIFLFSTTAQSHNGISDSNSRERYEFSVSEHSTDSVLRFAAKRLSELHQLGFLKAEKESFTTDSLNHYFVINKGQEFYYQLNSSIEPELLQKLRLIRYFKDEPVSFPEFETISKTIFNHFENNGYPFVSLQKTEIQFTDSIIETMLVLERMEYMVFDTLSRGGNVQISRFFLENHLGIIPGQPYSEKLVQHAGSRLQELDFAGLSSPLQLSFSPGKARLHLPLQKIRANRFDGVAGLSGTQNDEQPFQITGILNLYLSNTFGMGEFLDLSWRALARGTQILDLKGEYPYPFRLPVNTGIEFGLHRQDTSWLQIRTIPSLRFHTSATISWGAFMDYTRSSLISTRQYESFTVPPRNLDFTSRLYGLEFNKRTTAFRQNLLQRGHLINISAAAGNREIIKNSNLPEIIYEDLELKSLQINIKARAKFRLKISDRSTFSFDNQSAWLNGQNLPENQLYRLGGFQTLKGFDEYSMLASAYFTSNLEYRFFTGNMSFFSLFINGGWYEQKTGNQYINDFPVGMGTGINLETQAGIFALYFAMGRQNHIPFEFRNAKIHVGYVSTF
ncbi:MAG: outer membrane protein assembly factor [Bacteroidales bacterium]|nr:outer membrane protein assembly factor [Bacteroidales bacterium]